MMKSHKYQSVQKLVNLPRRRHLNITNQKIFNQQKINQQDINLVSNQLKSGRQYLLNTIYKQTQIFDDINYQFKFPASIFPDVPEGHTNTLSLVQKNQFDDVYEDNFGQKLNQEQLYQISQRGQFEVFSKNQRARFPNTWKVNDCIVRGRVNINKIWQDGLGTCYSFFVFSFNNFKTTIPQCLMKILKLPLRLIQILIGTKSINKLHTPDYHREVVKDFWSDIIQNQLNNVNKIIGKDFLELLYMKFQYKSFVNNKIQDIIDIVDIQNQLQNKNNTKLQKISTLKQKIMVIQSDFNKQWNMIRRRTLQTIQKQNPNIPPNSQFMQKKYNQQKFKLYLMHVRKQLPKTNGMTYDSIQAIISIIFIINFINQNLKVKQEALNKIYNDIQAKIQREHPIRSKQGQFFQKALNKEYQQQRIKYEEIFYNQLLNNLSINNLFNNTYQTIYRKYIKFRQFYSTLITQKKNSMMCLYEPTRVFKSTYPLLPPYESYTKQYSGSKYYYLKKQQELTSDTSHHFWKCSLYWMRITTWTLNWIITLIGIAWVGPFGLRCLCGTESFQYDYNCNLETGQKIPLLRQTVLVKFKNVLDSIRKSRQNFQSQPDRGLMGKNFSRICNIIQCYFLMLFVIGVIGVLTLYPIAIILLSALSILLVITFWFWIPVSLIVCYLFNVFVFEFQVSRTSTECIIRCVPLLSILVRFIWYLLLIVFSVVLLVLIAPLFCLLYTCFLIIQRFFRTMFDNIMVCVIGCLGRTPSIDTLIAKKISGPGMSHIYFNKISENNVYLLIQSALQKLFIAKFILLTKQRIEQQSKKYRASLRYVLNPFGHNQPNINYQYNRVQKSTNQLLENFNKKASHYLQRYPQNPYNIRFNQSQLNKYLENSVRIVKNYVEKHNIQQCIFQESNVAYKDYQELTRVLWRQIFGSGDQIFQPVQQLDQRLVIDKNVVSNTNQFQRNMLFIQDTLKGQVSHPIQTLKIAHKEVSILDKDKQFNIIKQICDIHTKNSGNNIFLDLQNPNCLIVPPRNLQQLKNYDKQVDLSIRDNIFRKYNKLIELNY